MTTLYKPALIETAEQAEALAVGTVAFTPEEREGRMIYRADAAVRDQHGWGTDYDERGEPYTVENEDVVGWTALVPIEAEEQHVAPDAITYARYVTAWEEA